MARYADAIDLPVSPREAFDYLADFSRTAEWDPSVVDARRLTPGEIRLGSSFEVIVSLLGRRVPLEYRITEFARPSRLVLSGGTPSLRSIDEIAFVPRSGGTRVTYEARLELPGILRLADPIVCLLLRRIGPQALRGLRERLARKNVRTRKNAGKEARRNARDRAGAPLREPARTRPSARRSRPETSGRVRKGAR